VGVLNVVLSGRDAPSGSACVRLPATCNTRGVTKISVAEMRNGFVLQNVAALFSPYSNTGNPFLRTTQNHLPSGAHLHFPWPSEWGGRRRWIPQAKEHAADRFRSPDAVLAAGCAVFGATPSSGVLGT
jgi:hypothetical protein